MKKTIFLSIAAALVITQNACSDPDNSFTPAYRLTVSADTTISVSIDANRVFQTIDGFASSDAWSMDYVGKYWSSDQKEGIAKLLFSKDVKNGQPEGIGLSMWRVNLGGGTAEQGTASGIENEERRAECFLNSDGSYNWNKAAGQQYFMEKAKNYGVNRFVLFSNTPPVYYTRNGKGFSNSGSYSNLKADAYPKFADFLATSAAHFAEKGYNISMISPVNEPQYNWDGGQEGSGWQNAEVARLVKELDKSLTVKNLSATQILVGEAGDWRYLYETSGKAGAGRSRVIDDLFSTSSPNYIGNLPHVPSLICGHSYWLDRTWTELQTTRAKVATAAQAKGLKTYQTEWSMMSDKYEGLASYDNPSQMDLALVMAKVLHADLTVANVSSWSYWTSCDRERWGHKSRFFLIKLQPVGGDYAALTTGGTHTTTKNLWTLGNYSLFIRPGYNRVSVSVPLTDNSVLASAYLSPEKDRLVVVYTNLKKKSVKVENRLNGFSAGEPKQYVTSSGRDLKEVSSFETFVLPARSVTTMVYPLNK